MVQRIRATGVKAIFSETSLPPRAAETIGREAGVKVVVGEDALYGDALGLPGSDGDTYLKMIRHNTATIVGCSYRSSSGVERREVGQDGVVDLAGQVAL